MKRPVFFAAATLALLAAWPAHAQHATHGSAPAAASPASQAYMDAMKTMDAAMAATPMTGRPGEDFALMMIPHHQSAVDMAKAYLASGEDDPELSRLSREIIASQEKEIAFLRDWLAAKKR
jgi:uncharacterized protein (DUF305 family)